MILRISKEELEQLLKSAFEHGMIAGYGIDHEHLAEEEYQACKKYLESVKELK